MSPLFSIFKNETDFKLPPDQFVLLHLKRVHLMEWARAVMAAALGLQRGEPLPRIILQAEGNDVEIQIGGTSYYGRSARICEPAVYNMCLTALSFPMSQTPMSSVLPKQNFEI